MAGRSGIALMIMLLAMVQHGFGQNPDAKKKPNYELRNIDFVERRTNDTTLNFARLYARATLPLVNPVFSKKGQDEWLPLGPNGEEDLAGTGRINSMCFHPQDTNIWYICVAQGGLWKSLNRGESWISISGNLPILRTSSLVIHPDNADIMYVALGDYAYLGHNLQANENKRNSHYGLGIYKTIDGGQNWSPTGLSFKQLDFEGSLISRIKMHPSDPSRLIAIGQTGSYVTLDSGATWQRTSQSLFWSLVQDPVNPNVLYASTGYVHSYKIGEAAILKSTDFGMSWTELNSTIPKTGQVQRIELAIAPSDNNYIYAIACDTLGGFYGFYKSVNGGTSFTQVLSNQYEYNILNGSLDSTPGGQGRYDLAICVDRYDKEHVLIGGINIWQTHDGGSGFKPVTYWALNYSRLSLHADVHAIVQHPSNSSYFACHDGGISRTFQVFDEEPDSLKMQIVNTRWVDYTRGLNISSFYRLGVNAVNGVEIMAGAQDNSTVYTNGDSFMNISGGDGMEAVFMDDQNFRYTSSQNGSIYAFSLFGGDMYYAGTIEKPNNESGEWTTPFVAANQVLYVLFENLYSYVENIEVGKHTVFPDFQDGYRRTGTALDVQKSNGKRIYLAKRGFLSAGIKNQIWTSPDFGNNWNDIGSALPGNSYPAYIEMSQLNPDHVWICFSGFDSLNKVFYSQDAGDNWVNITYDLPNIPVNCVVHQEDGTGLIYIGTDNGVYYLKKGALAWEYYSYSLPKVIVSELEIDTNNKTLVAATFGRGLWEAGLVDYDSNFVIIESIVFTEPVLNLYPNPTQAFLNLSLESFVNGEAKIQLIDITGKIVYEELAELNSGEKMSRSIPVSFLSTGEYFVLVSYEKSRKTARFTKY